MNNNNLSFAIEAITDAALNKQHKLSVEEYKKHLAVLLSNKELSCSVTNVSFGGIIKLERSAKMFGGYINELEFI